MNLTRIFPRASARGLCRYLVIAALSASVSAFVFAKAQPLSPGLQPFIPTRIDWLTTTLQASLRDEELQTNGYQLEITELDPETVLIYVRYLPSVNREIMNESIDTARQVIHMTANSYGWDKWIKIREDVQLEKLDKKS